MQNALDLYPYGNSGHQRVNPCKMKAQLDVAVVMVCSACTGARGAIWRIQLYL